MRNGKENQINFIIETNTLTIPKPNGTFDIIKIGTDEF